jgi:hypothetical protein
MPGAGQRADVQEDRSLCVLVRFQSIIKNMLEIVG